MREDFIYYLWDNRLLYLNLSTTNGNELVILSPGSRNYDSGPDYNNVKVKIGDTIWFGQMEVHVSASDWYKHKHHQDKNYKNVILHVVYENDIDTLDIPTLEIKDKFNTVLFHNFYSFIHSKAWIPCGNYIGSVQDFTIMSWLERMLVEHLEKKAMELEFKLKANLYDWEQSFYQRFIRYFGLRVNNDAFERLASLLPLKIIMKHADNETSISSMMFGCAGFLERDFEEEYPSLLKQEYKVLKAKYNLTTMSVDTWKFLRLRPQNFPTVRLAQLSKVIAQNTNMFSRIRDSDDIDDIYKIFDIELCDYWDNHFLLGKTSKNKKRKNLGRTTTDIVIINAIVPLLFYYGHYHSLQIYKDKAIKYLELITAENNIIIRKFAQCGIYLKDAAQTQSILHMYNNYCKRRRCLECRIFAVLSKRDGLNI